MGSGVSLAAWKPGAWKANAWRAGAWESGATQPETPPTFSGGGSRPQRDAKRPRNDDDEVLLMVLL